MILISVRSDSMIYNYRGFSRRLWNMDFVANNLFDGRRILALTLADNFSR